MGVVVVVVVVSDALIWFRELKAVKKKLWKLQEPMIWIQQGAGIDALMELESVMSAAESVDVAPNRLLS